MILETERIIATTEQSTITTLTKQDIQRAVDEYIAELDSSLWALNQQVPIITLVGLVERHIALTISIDSPKPRAGISRTPYPRCYVRVPRMLRHPCNSPANFNAEYDALPDIGRACDHNLIATASVAGFMALAFVIRKFGLPGQTQLLGTPAEEDGGGKIDLIRKGAYDNVDISLMMGEVPL